ncbi:MAG: PQQ-binding-like beta-propeller repeat protein [Gemmataceae bacterium]
MPMRCLLLLACVVAFSPTARASDWWNWRGPWQTGVSPEKDLPSKFSLDPKDPDGNLVWKAPYGCRSTPLIINGKVFIINGCGDGVSQQERVMAFDADTGKVLWEYKFNVWHTDIVVSRLGWANLAGDPKTGYVYAHGTQGLLLCLDSDGKLKWQRNLTEDFGRVSGYGGRLPSPTVADDLVVLSMNNSSWGDQAKGATRFVAFNKMNGQVVWWADPVGQPKDSYHSCPVVASIGGRKQVIGGCGEGSLVGLELNTGKVLWRYKLGTAMINATPVVQGNLVFAGHGEENDDSNLHGRIVCLDASKITDGAPEEVWKHDGIEVRYASPLVDGDRVYFPNDIGRLFCRDIKTGNKIWTFAYGRNSRGSPLMADGKIYVGEVGAKFHILKPGAKKCERLFEMEFFSEGGKADVEINGTAAAANGRVYFSTSEETYCIATPEGRKHSATAKSKDGALKITGVPAELQIYPADVTVQPGAKVKLELRAYDEFGNPAVVKGDATWTLPTPPVPPGKKSGPPALKGTISGDATSALLNVDAKAPSQGGYVMVEMGKMKAKARVRVAPTFPYAQDFEKIPDGAVPGGWTNTQGKWLVKTLKDGSKVLAKVNDKASPLLARGNAYISVPDAKNYVIQADVMGTKVGSDMPDIGVVNERYTLFLAGNIQKLRIVSWDALPRLDKTIPFEWQPDTWYTLKLVVEDGGKSATIKGKCWPKGKEEPAEWTLQVTDPYPNGEGAAAVYAYVTGIPASGGPGTEVYVDNVKITPRK